MQNRVLTLSALAAVLLTLPASSAEVREHPRAVVELFTSQGCSSCPQADARLIELGAAPDIIALAYHVDYWDYIGWPDTFGDKAYSDLQKDYAQSWGSSAIYTPQVIINGAKGVVGTHSKDVTAALDAAKLDLPVTLAVGKDMLDVDVEARAGAPEAMVWLVTFKDRAEVVIGRGENAGKTMKYSQIVTGRQMLGMWDSVSGTHLKLPLSELMTNGSNGAVILVQGDKAGLPGPILGAASVQL